jgi:hypothetical protein
MCVQGALSSVPEPPLPGAQRFDDQPFPISGHIEFRFLRDSEQFQNGLFDYQA